jgi:thermostable 8-oxoguanine DNA glycosylase
MNLMHRENGMLLIRQEQIEKFRQIRDRFYNKTKVPAADDWQDWNDDDVWWHLVAQVIAVGNSLPAQKFENNTGLKGEAAYENLIRMQEVDQARTINRVLREVGTRYASSSISKCRKTVALVHNLKALQSKGGPKMFMKTLSQLKGPDADKKRIECLMMDLKFLKSKSARDFLMELGLLKNAIAFDVRVRNVMDKMGIETPKGFESDPQLYGAIESDILTEICKPLGISGIEFDRMLYQNYDEIMVMDSN